VARGWESKSVESQIEAAEKRRTPRHKPVSPEQLDTERKCDSLLLHRTRVMRDLESCQNPRYRKTLEDGLAFLEAQLAGLGWQK
jgi:hypothetical protein